MTDMIYNHISLKIPGSDDHFLINAFGHATWLSPQEKSHLIMQLERESKHKTTHSFASALANPRLWRLAFIYFCIALGNLGLAFWHADEE